MMTVLALLMWALSQQAVSTVEGVVLRDSTNQPLANIQVGLWPTSLEAKTDASGAYVFRAVPPGQYTLVVIHDGIRVKVPATMNFPQRMNITLRIPAAPAISGTVFDPNGERLAAARVQAFRRVYTLSGQRMEAIAETLTNDRGDYRLFWLRPGEYTIGASYSDREQLSALGGLRLSSNLSKPDDGYPLLYSQSVDLRPGGEMTNINIPLKEGAYVPVLVRLLDPEGKSVCARLAVVPLNGAVNGDKDFGPPVCGPVVPRLLPGSYSVLALTKGLASDVVPINVPCRNIEGCIVELKKTVDVGGRVLLDGAPLRTPSAIRAVLVRNWPNIDQRIPAEMNPDGSFVFKDVGPGAFSITVESLPDDTFVRSIQTASVAGGGRGGRGGVGGRDVLSDIRFDASFTGEINVQLSSAGGVAEGLVVDREGRPVPGAQVVFTPIAGFLRREDQYKVVTADAIGKFRAGGIAPGSYRAYAFEELAPGAHFALSTNSALAVPYVSRGQLATFDGSERRELRFVVIPASETAGALR
jgi:hypothetical protein